MGRPDEGQAIVGSSIALLQERFKRLQRLKEKREERRIQQLWCQLAHANQVKDIHQLALGLNLNQPHQSCDNQRVIVQQQQQQFPSNTVKEPYNFFEKMDVDTSLHL